MARLGIDLGGTKIEAAIVEDDGAIHVRQRIPTPPGYQAKLEAIAALVQSVESRRGVHGLPAGLAHPGSHNPRTGLMRNANSTALNGQALDRDVSAALGREVRCANDANCFALSEARDGAGAGAHSVFGVILGTGVGGGLVIGGELITGAHGNAGEWGHTALPWPEAGEIPGPPCFCGLNGCVETWCSGPALAADHRRVTGQTLTADAIAAAASAGDEPARATLDRHAARLGRALASVVNIVDPEVIVLGGGLSNLTGLPERLETALAPWTFTDEPLTRIVRNTHGDSSGVRGAAWLWPA
ncbi:ROK family protein [Alkalicaulis satelles]|uniref:ROK family protein n=1 Tax=Alkalicaulis satelles TaxID=2609175 RepID=A0A5M6ZCR9_9PROT|nr:ROK family protein [Alkalicaulis satelles]KAA5801694.1 ROK family protein [Alkalicaulis satelles]